MLLATSYPGGPIALIAVIIAMICLPISLLALPSGILTRQIQAPKHWPVSYRLLSVAGSLALISLIASLAFVASLMADPGNPDSGSISDRFSSKSYLIHDSPIWLPLLLGSLTIMTIAHRLRQKVTPGFAPPTTPPSR